MTSSGRVAVGERNQCSSWADGVAADECVREVGDIAARSVMRGETRELCAKPQGHLGQFVAILKVVTRLSSVVSTSLNAGSVSPLPRTVSVIEFSVLA